MRNDEIIKDLIVQNKNDLYNKLSCERAVYNKLLKEIKEIKLLLSTLQEEKFKEFRDEKTHRLKKAKFEINFAQALISYYKKTFKACCSWIDKSTED